MTQSGYELKVRELFESIFRVMMIFFLSVVDSNSACDKIRTIRARTPAYKILLNLYAKYFFKARSCLTEMNIFRLMSLVQLQLRSAASESIQPVEIIWVDLNSN